MIKTLFTILLALPFFTYAQVQLGCGDTFTDSGGAGSTYSAGESTTYTICPDANGFVRVDFSSFNTELGYDYLTVYNGSTAGVNLLGTFDGTTIDPFIESTAANGCLTFVFTSDGSVENAGWVASVSCIGGQPDPVDLTNIRSYNGDVELSYDYTFIPNSQRRAMTFGAKVGNLINQLSSGNIMTVTVNDGTSNVYTGTQTFSIAALDTQYVWLATNFIPAINNTFTVTIALQADDNNTNNSKTFTFQTQNDYYAHDFTSTTTVGASSLGTDYYFVNGFFFHGTGTIYSVDIKLASGTTPNQTIRAFISSNNGFESEGTKLITASDINNGQFTRVYLDPPVNVTNTGDGFYYYCGVGNENLTGTLNTFTNVNNNDDNASGMLQNGVFGPFDKSLAIRMNLNAGCSGFDATRTVVAAQSCNPNSGRINLNITTGGTSIINQNTISWTGTSSGSLSNQSNLSSISGLATGTYSVTITNNGCSVTLSNIIITSTVSPSLTISQTSPISCFGNSDGALSYVVNGTATGYSFVWNTNSTSSSLSNLSSGVYTVSGTNGSCVLSQSFTLQDPAQIAIAATKTNVSACGGSNGSIQLNCAGGTSTSYLYTWIGPVTGSSGVGFGNTFSINNLTAGNYLITVTNGSCVNNTTVSISESSAPVITISNIVPISCPGDSDGDLKVLSSDNISQYNFLWSNSATGVNLNNVQAGTYSVVGTNGTCTVSANFVLLDPAVIEISGISGISSVNTTVIGGTGTLTYSWSGPSGFTSTSQNLSTLSALGTYTMTVTDQKGCTATRAFILAFLGNDELPSNTKNYKFYPNPSNSFINFELDNEVAEINVFDYLGKIINVLYVHGDSETLNLDSYSNGIYFFNLISKEKQILFKSKFSVIK